MKKFILKSAIIFILSLLLFRFTVISLVNEYEEKILSQISTSNINELKRDVLKSIKENNEKEAILHPEDAKELSAFMKKIITEFFTKNVSQIHNAVLSPVIHFDIAPAPIPIIISLLNKFFLKYLANSI